MREGQPVHMMKQLRVSAIDPATHTVTLTQPTAAPAPDTRNQPLTQPTAGSGVTVTIDFGAAEPLPAGLAGIQPELRTIGASALVELKT
jgi:hypothetical protein